MNSRTDNNPNLSPLSNIQPGKWARVKAVKGGPGLSHRLASMGILVGSEVMLVRGKKRGPIIVQVGGGRYVLGRGMSKKIMVEQL